MKTQIDTTKYTEHKHPGKFEGESAATEYFWEQAMNGDGEELYAEDYDEEGYCMECPVATIFYVNADEAEAFNLPIRATFMIREDSQGFVYGSVHASREEAKKDFLNWLGLPSLS